MKNILHSESVSDYEKWNMFREILLKYLNIVDEENKNSDEILNFVPQTFRRKARLLYEKILRSGKIVWDERGVISIDGRFIPRSNITDLINDVVRPRKNTNPNGWKAFYNALREINIPQEYIGNQKRWNSFAT
ncbi:hypothetical protein J437_LFUL019349 [Ladona fulva]|uniref:Uncharacterized protein n=1 Tax=Ladona fulva TaxID=123851 RepID=A0A8K0KTR5_LADFU|nr:hypothetical protein J437_LFUL019349 [Ladona fulva]